MESQYHVHKFVQSLIGFALDPFAPAMLAMRIIVRPTYVILEVGAEHDGQALGEPLFLDWAATQLIA